MSIDLEQFHAVFFEESFEGLEVMESGLLNLVLGAAIPDLETKLGKDFIEKLRDRNLHLEIHLDKNIYWERIRIPCLSFVLQLVGQNPILQGKKIR